MPRLVLTSKAESDLEAIHEHYESKMGSSGADKIIARLIDALRSLQQFTGLGRPSQTPGIRELVFTDLPFIAPYQVIREEIQVVRVLHQRVERPENW